MKTLFDESTLSQLCDYNEVMWNSFLTNIFSSLLRHSSSVLYCLFISGQVTKLEVLSWCG